MKHLLQSVRRAGNKLWRTIRYDLSFFNPLRAAEDALLLLIALQVAVLGINLVNSNNPILGLRLEGRLVGQLHNPDFRSQTNAIIRDYENTSLAVTVADKASAITLRQLGVNIDEKQTQAKLLAEGRTGNVLARLVDQDLAPFGIRNISFLGHPSFNNELAKAYIATLDQEIQIPPENAYFSFNSQAMVHPDKPGRAIDVEAALAALRSANPGKNTQVMLPTKQVPAIVTSSMLTPLLPEVQSIAQKPLIIGAGESRTTLSPQQLIELIVPKVIPDPKDAKKTTAQVAFDEAKLNAIVDEVVSRAVVAPKPTIMRGGVVVQQGKSGISTEDSHSLARVLTVLIQRQTGAAAPDEAHIPLVTVSPPIVRQAVSTNNTQSRTGTGLVRLTFDDGPGGYTNQILDILKRYNVHAAFYVVGRNVYSYPDQMQRTKNEGHTICNHSFSHANLARLSGAGVRQELANTQAAIQQTTGVTPTCFRPPYGAHNQTVRDVAASLGLSVDMWSIDTRDWARPGSSVITQRVLNNTHSGAVVLMHILNQQTVTALPSIIEGIRAQGYTLE